MKRGFKTRMQWNVRERLSLAVAALLLAKIVFSILVWRSESANSSSPVHFTYGIAAQWRFDSEPTIRCSTEYENGNGMTTDSQRANFGIFYQLRTRSIDDSSGYAR